VVVVGTARQGLDLVAHRGVDAEEEVGDLLVGP
jgi:hypothetical protein